MRTWMLIVCMVAGCGEKRPAAGMERGDCKKGTCEAGLTCLSNVCVSASTPAMPNAEPREGPAANVTSPGAAPVAADSAPFPTVILVSGDGGPNDEIDSALVVACAESKTKVSDSARMCADLLNPGDKVSSIKDVNVVELGKRFGEYCHAGPIVRGPTQDAFAVTMPATPYGRFLIFPASRAHDVKLSDTSPTIDKTKQSDITKLVAATFKGTMAWGEPYQLQGEAIVRTILHTDVDGDGLPDTIYSVEAPTPADTLTFFSAILGDLSTRRGGIAPLLVEKSDHTEVVGAIDLDRDGTDELLLVSGTHESAGAFVGRYSNGALTRFGGWSCGL